MNRQDLSQEVSVQGDQAAQNAMDAQRLLEETEIARRTGQSSMQNLQMLKVSPQSILFLLTSNITNFEVWTLGNEFNSKYLVSDLIRSPGRKTGGS